MGIPLLENLYLHMEHTLHKGAENGSILSPELELTGVPVDA